MADDGGIQKPTSAYQYFYKDHIQVIRSQTQGTLDISKVGGQTSAAWHALDAAAKAPYERLAAQDRARYEKESSEADAAKEEAQAAARAAYSAAEATGPRTTRAPLAPPPRERKVTAPEDLTDEQRERRDARKAEVAAARAERQKRADEVEKQRQAVQEAHRNQAQKRLRYLLAQSDIFRTHFGLGQVAEAEVEPEPAAKAPPAAAPGSAAKRRAASPEAAPGDGSEEAVEADAEGPPTFLTAQPPSIKGSMRAYQLEGLNWMINLQTQGINGVLADEMGLGKTLQSISILAYMRDFRGISGPHLVLLPKSTLGNWRGEFATFCPALRVLPLHGDRAEREALIEQRLRPGVPQEERDWDVCLTTYEVARMEVKSLEKIGWRYLIIDEAHKLKNENSQVSGTARAMNADHRLLLTGTPLQNNLHELWALLNILLPDVFADASQFSEFFNLDTGDTDAKKTVITQLHKILRPFMLRRLKSDAAKELPPKTETILYTRLSDMQRRLYRDLLMRNIDCVNSTGAGIQRTALLNIVMQLRKCCNHPYLFPGMEDRSLDPLGEHLVDACGKVKLLDKLLSRLKERGHRVLVFSQMTRMLDILEDLMHMRGHEYCRIDGDTSYDQRDELIDAYNAPNSTKFCFLLSTRAGGLGINLQTADVVILFDSDWNPQADLQAQDRAHRIGQRRAVRVFRLVTEDTVEEKVVERAQQKLKLDAMVVQQGRLQEKAALGKDDILQALRFGADSVFRSEGAEVTDEDIDIILAKGEAKTAALNEKLSQMEKGDLLDFRLDGGMSTQTFEGKDFSDRANRQAQQGWFGIDTGKRHRKPVDMLTAAPPAPAPAPPKKVLKLPPSLAVPPMHGWQLYDMARIQALQQQAHDKLAALREAGNEVPEDGPTLEAILFTPEEVEERRRLLTEGFAGWGSRHLIRLYVDACTQFGRHSHAKIARAVGKTEEEGILVLWLVCPACGFRVTVSSLGRQAQAHKAAAVSTAVDLLTAPYERNDEGKITLKSLTQRELGDVFQALGHQPQRALDLCRWLYNDGMLVKELAAASGTRETRHNFGKAFLTQLSSIATARGGLELESTCTAQDGTIKLVCKASHGTARGGAVETVVIPMLQGPQQKKRYTVCVSSQVGCAMNCQFCHTGRMGLLANLQAAQIVEQVVIAKRHLNEIGDTTPITGVVFMGMGEPFDNYENVSKAVKVMTEKSGTGLRLSAGRVTVSTVGIVPRIRQFCEDPNMRANLAVSLHATEDTIRDWLVPVNQRHDLEDLMQTLEEFFPRELPPGTPANGQRRLLVIQYTLLRGVNDSLEDGVRLGALARRLHCVVNLITFNDHPGTPFRRAEEHTAAAFRAAVSTSGTLCTLRESKGDDGASACGQLGNMATVAVAGRKPVPVGKAARAATASVS